MATWDRLRELPVAIEAISTETLSLAVGEWTRKTTVISLGGRGETGAGEDVTYDADEHDRFPELDLRGEWTLESLSAHLDSTALFTATPTQAAYRDYRRWALESAALDLALRQAGTTLAAALDRKPRPVRFVSSTRAEDLDPWLELYPNLRFKLDPTPKWTDELITKRAAAGNVDTLDLKGAYHGTSVDNPPNFELYRRVLAAFPAAWIEDPALTPETTELIEGHRARVTWDAPIHSWADVEALPFTPRFLNSKPSRFGSLARLFEFYDRCSAVGIGLYGGGQFELGPGRGQIQLLASLFHPDGPNDVAPGGFNGAPVAGLPTSPLRLAEQPGFRA
jgi:hypothetical protein